MKFNFTKSIARYLRAAIGMVLTMSLVFQVAFNTAIGTANAVTNNNAILVAASMSEMADKAGQAVDNVADSIDRTAAKLRDDAKDVDVVGRAQQQVNKVKAAADENEYRNRGKARAAIDRAQDNIGDSARAAGDEAKYAVRKGANKAESQAKQVKAKGEETKGNVVDAVKGFFGK